MKPGLLKNRLLLLALSLIPCTSFAQDTGDTPDNRLALLCKTWGYVKYYHQKQCDFHWDDILNKTINLAITSTTNEQFNTVLMNMLNGVGQNEQRTDPGNRPDTNILVNTEWINDAILSRPVKNFLNTFSSRIVPSRSNCLVTTNLGNPNSYGHIDFTGDPISIPIDYSVESNRLTVMFYYWNVINYFFPYRSLMDQPWDQTLIELIPVFRAPQTEPEFHRNIMKMANRLHDSHAGVVSDILNNTFWNGSYRPKIYLERIEDQCVVRRVEGIRGILPGFILTELDGQPVTKIADSLEHYLPYSTPAAKFRVIYDLMTRGQEGTQIRLTLLNNQGQSITKIVRRDCLTEDWLTWRYGEKSKDAYKITECGYGYVNMGRLMPTDVDAMYAELKSAPAIIFDLRNYPNSTLPRLAQLLFKNQITSALYYHPALTFNIVMDLQYYMPGWFYKATDGNSASTFHNPNAYQGKVYILVDQNTQSQAEYTCQYLSYHPNATVIGRQTSGADGSVGQIVLPGGIKTLFTCCDWRYADGYQQQRKGVKIDSIVEPTIQGVREGKDEILLAALKCISGLPSNPFKPLNVTVFPNPVVSGEIKVTLSSSEYSTIKLSLIDLTGKLIFQDHLICQPGDQTFYINLPKTTPGMYIFKVQDERQSLITKLIIE